MSVLKLKQNGAWVPISVGAQGPRGDVGPANTLTIGTVISGIEASATITGEAPNQVLNLVLKQGDKGNPGDAAPTITGITIRQSDYHMIVTLSDGTSYDAGYCRGAAGNGIASIALKSGTHAAGTTDTYEITFTDGTTFDFFVYNGANGTGAGDMLASTYDPQGKAQDIFAYVDNAVSGVTADDVTFSDGETFQQKYDSGELKGKDGVGIQKVEQTTISNEDGGTNVITVTKTDGSSSTFSVKNGNKGSDGYTPVKGTDYFTEADKNELVNLVLANFTNVSEVGM